MAKNKVDKVQELIQLDCTEKENIKKLNDELLTIPVIARHTKGEKVSTETLERVVLLISQKSSCNIRPSALAPDVWTNKKSIIWKSVVVNDDKKAIYVGTVYGKTLWEVLGKCAILMYAKLKS